MTRKINEPVTKSRKKPKWAPFDSPVSRPFGRGAESRIDAVARVVAMTAVRDCAGHARFELSDGNLPLQRRLLFLGFGRAPHMSSDNVPFDHPPPIRTWLPPVLPRTAWPTRLTAGRDGRRDIVSDQGGSSGGTSGGPAIPCHAAEPLHARRRRSIAHLNHRSKVGESRTGAVAVDGHSQPTEQARPFAENLESCSLVPAAKRLAVSSHAPPTKRESTQPQS